MIISWCLVGFVSGILEILIFYFIDDGDITIGSILTILGFTMFGWLSFLFMAATLLERIIKTFLRL
jgi:hypothetical protein